MNDLEDKIREIGILPVIKLEKVDSGAKLAEALVMGGLPAAEVTFRSGGADAVIRAMLDKYPDMMVGAGTVLTIEQAEAAVAAGAKFIVSPGFDEELVDRCIEIGVPVFPGCVTPSEIQRAIKRGLKTVKFFPAKQFGGLDTIKALAGPFPGIQFLPTGGINMDNLQLFISNKNIIACGGTFMVADQYLEEEDWDKISELCRSAVKIVRKAREK